MQNDIVPIVVSISIDKKDLAHRIATLLVEEKLIACAQVSAIQSIYQWEGIQSTEEYLIQCKTQQAHLSKIEETVREIHPYDVPEIIATPIIWAHQPYLDWLVTQLS